MIAGYGYWLLSSLGSLHGWHLLISRKLVFGEAAFRSNLAQIGGTVFWFFIMGSQVRLLQSDHSYTDPVHTKSKSCCSWLPGASSQSLDCYCTSVQSFAPGVFPSGIDGFLTSVVWQLVAWLGLFLVHLLQWPLFREVILNWKTAHDTPLLKINHWWCCIRVHVLRPLLPLQLHLRSLLPPTLYPMEAIFFYNVLYSVFVICLGICSQPLLLPMLLLCG